MTIHLQKPLGLDADPEWRRLRQSVETARDRRDGTVSKRQNKLSHYVHEQMRARKIAQEAAKQA